MLDPKWLMVKYPAGAGGIIILHCFSTAQNVVDWHGKTDPIEFINKNFQLQSGMLPIELEKPYSLSWFTRQLPFTRGLNLSKEEVNIEAAKEKIVNEAMCNGLHIPFWYTRTVNPSWFDGLSFGISADDSSKNWLIKRRKMLFYKIENENIIDLRFHHSDPSRKKFYLNFDFKDDPISIYKDKILDELVKEDFYKDKCDQPHIGDININLSDLLDQKKHKLIFEHMEKLIDAPLDRHWCEPALKRWTKIWRDL